MYRMGTISAKRVSAKSRQSIYVWPYRFCFAWFLGLLGGFLRFFGGLLWLFCGPFCHFSCAGYRLGPTNGLAAGDKAIQIMPFANQTLEPRLTDAVTAQLRKQIQHDGTFRLATHDDGDIVVTGAIIRYTR